MTVSEQIIQVLDALCEKFGIAVEWTGDNVLPYATMLLTKLVSYEIWTSAAWLVIAMIVMIIVISFWKRVRMKKIILDECTLVVIGIITGIGTLAAVASIISNTMDIIKCITFPELYVFECVQQLVK